MFDFFQRSDVKKITQTAAAAVGATIGYVALKNIVHKNDLEESLLEKYPALKNTCFAPVLSRHYVILKPLNFDAVVKQIELFVKECHKSDKSATFCANRLSADINRELNVVVEKGRRISN